jgi:hypothetical protein
MRCVGRYFCVGMVRWNLPGKDYVTNLGGLDVVGLEEALEIEDLQLRVLLGNLEELAEVGIGVDDLLVHEALGLGVGADGGGHLAAAHESTLGLTEEDAELLANLDGLLEDALTLGLAIIGNLGALALLTGLLELTGNTLLQLLHVGEDGGEGLAEGAHLGDEGVELGHDVDLLGNLGNGGSGDGGRGSNRGGSNGGGDGGRGSSNRGSDGGRGSNGLLLGGGGLTVGSLSGSAHFISGPKVVYTVPKRRNFRASILAIGGQKNGEKSGEPGVFLWVL